MTEGNDSQAVQVTLVSQSLLLQTQTNGSIILHGQQSQPTPTSTLTPTPKTGDPTWYNLNLQPDLDRAEDSQLSTTGKTESTQEQTGKQTSNLLEHSTGTWKFKIKSKNANDYG